MTQFINRSMVTAAAVLIPLTPALALTPEEMLDEMIAMQAKMGSEITYASADRDGDLLTVTGITVTQTSEGGNVSYSVGEIYIRALGADEVELTYPPEIATDIKMDIEGAEQVIPLLVAVEGAARVKADGDARTWTFDYPSVAFQVDIPEPEPGVEGTVKATMADLVGTMSMASAEGPMSYDMTIAGTDYDVSFAESEADALDLSGQIGAMVIRGTSPLIDATDPGAMFSSDVPASMTAESGAFTTNFAFSEDGAGMEGTFNGSGSTLAVDFGAGSIGYGFSYRDLEVAVGGAAVPIPGASGSLSELGMDFRMPVSVTEDLQDVKIGVTIAGLSVSDQLWSLVDAGGVIPRDPADVILKMSATGRALVNFFDPGVIEAYDGKMPFEFGDISLDEARVTAGGAEITAQGAGQIDLSGPFPTPVGAVDLTIDGVQGLLGKLGEIGLVPQEQAMPVQMMLGMFAKPGTEPDSFTSRIEAGADGSIIANGIPLQ